MAIIDTFFLPLRTVVWTLSWLTSTPGWLSRMNKLFRPRQCAKSSSAIRLGLFGASKIAPMAVINPALSHPDVIVAAVAARDKTKAEAYAKKYDIPIVHNSYDDLLADTSIDAVYIPLPNGLHAEWALKSLKAGKHVLLEKPSTSNAEEARKLFESPLLQQPNAPVLLEAFHYRFHPAFTVFKSLIGDPTKITKASASWLLPSGILALDDIRFQYDLAGGAYMDIGTYPTSWLRHTFEREPEECISAKHTPLPAPLDKAEPNIDLGMEATWRFPGGAFGHLDASLHSTGGYSWLPNFMGKQLPTIKCPYIKAEVKDDSGEEQVTKRVVLWFPGIPTFWHRIDVEEIHTTSQKTWQNRKSIKAYEWPDKLSSGKPGEAWWTTYRYQLEEFVNAIKGRQGSGVWVSHADSMAQMKMIDSAYTKAGLPLRRTAKYKI